jgi:hypothetical protein
MSHLKDSSTPPFKRFLNSIICASYSAAVNSTGCIPLFAAMATDSLHDESTLQLS